MSAGHTPESPMAECGNLVFKIIVMLLEWIDEKLGKQEWGSTSTKAH